MTRTCKCATKSGAPQTPVRTTTPHRAWLIDHGPFLAIPACAGITYTMGGIAIDGQARVLDTTGMPITGLYAAGATTGGLEGGPAIGYVGGLSKSAVFGFIAGGHIGAAHGTPAR